MRVYVLAIVAIMKMMWNRDKGKCHRRRLAKDNASENCEKNTHDGYW